MLTRSQSFPARIPRSCFKVKIEGSPLRPQTLHVPLNEKSQEYSLVFCGEYPETKRVNNQMCFLVETLSEKEWWSIDEFVEYNLFTDEDVCDWVNEKNQIAKRCPNIKRRCFMCNRFATKGKTLCGRCPLDKKCDDYIYA